MYSVHVQYVFSHVLRPKQPINIHVYHMYMYITCFYDRFLAVQYMFDLHVIHVVIL